ncbi:MAG: type II toxin-antitoxin system mRNA interferase toxin, RelE/StbE family [Desulfobulbaceae bacterium]|nr:type II toxin-antitoxin system mRNA interferase toxin, RelE/StbE family [Desulfobulbaceae bacterium]
MAYRIIYPESYIRRARKFFKRHPDLIGQYRKILELLEINPRHPSLRLHPLKGKLAGLHSISINTGYRISLEMVISEQEIILVNIGTHDEVY